MENIRSSRTVCDAILTYSPIVFKISQENRISWIPAASSGKRKRFKTSCCVFRSQGQVRLTAYDSEASILRFLRQNEGCEVFNWRTSIARNSLHLQNFHKRRNEMFWNTVRSVCGFYWRANQHRKGSAAQNYRTELVLALGDTYQVGKPQLLKQAHTSIQRKACSGWRRDRARSVTW